MNPNWIVKILVITIFLGYAIEASPQQQTASSRVHVEHKVKGTIMNLACEPLLEAKITFKNKKRIQIVTPDQDGQFLVELPPGDYLVTVQLPAHSTNILKSRKLNVQQNRQGELCMWVETGAWATHCYCFDPTIEDSL
jgi:hypothetical protein